MAICPECCGDGKETCNNPDHGFISALSFHDTGRLGCPGCGHDEFHKVKNGGDCEVCQGSGEVTERLFQAYCKRYDFDYHEHIENVIEINNSMKECGRITMAKHIHADLMMEYAKLAQETDRPWEHFQFKLQGDIEWHNPSAGLAFRDDNEYRLKPHTIKIGNYDVPEPVRKPLEDGARYYYVNTSYIVCEDSAVSTSLWGNLHGDNIILRRGFIHLTRESAELHAKALISLTKKKE
ncbi:hypothetical protein ABLB84_06230 [Xenorhabdus szentirmaii]|uniref:hypothetical protein n=1 Tax=Xenorhabdus szentirmaii TaxID=290112 RepID=UPI0032B87829